ncbi:MAG TPA: alkaline phosphatase family protein [Thermoanaerobaculia bacterium]|nr:alkaline phosphatase family protein [Thermoanaerobaculia bacterium]
MIFALSGALLLAASIACRSGMPPADTGNAAAASRRVILISLDGAGASAFRELYRQGALDRGGFERFFREGQVADALIPVDPSLTATNHISLATGFPPAVTGIVGNAFYSGGSISAQTVNAFEAPVGTQTLWEAARRQGRQVGVLTWPGADARDERRTASWGLVYTNAADLEAQILTLSGADWKAVPGHSARSSAQVRIGEGEGTRTLDLVAVDTEDDGETRYDRVAVRAGQRETAPLRAGEWGRLAWDAGEGHTSSWLKLLALAPDLSEVRLYLGGIHRTVAYPDTFAGSLAEHSIYWPGEPDNRALVAGWQGRAGIDLATWTEQAEHLAAFWGETLRFAAAREDWDLLLSYNPVIDLAGHRLLLLDARQAGFSPERRDELTRARHRVWQAVDAELRKLLAGLDMTRTTVVVVSDHGMVPVHTSIDPDEVLAGLGGTTGRPAVSAIANGGAAFIYVEAGADPAIRASLLSDLASRYAEWRVDGEAPIEKVLTHEEAARIGLGHPNSGDLVLFARPGYTFRALPPGTAAAPAPVYGAHGHLTTHPEMQALYMAIGAGIAPGRGGTVRATEVAPRVAAWLGIEPPGRNPSGNAASRPDP